MLCWQKLQIYPEEEDIYHVIKFSSYKDYTIDKIRNYAACSAVIYKNNLAIRSDSKIIQTNISFNKYDLYGLYLGLELANKLKAKNIKVESSNESIISIMNDSKYLYKFVSRVNNIESNILSKIIELHKNFDLIMYSLITVENNINVNNLSKDTLLQYL